MLRTHPHRIFRRSTRRHALILALALLAPWLMAAPSVGALIPTKPAIAAGGDHSLMLRYDGTVWASGNNGYGQLGDGTTTTRSTPVQVSGLTNITAIAAGWYHSLALRSDGTVWAWGWNGAGQLGDGTTTDRSTPVQVSSLTNITAIAAGAAHSLAIKSDGTVWAWGNNGAGQLGDGTTTYRTTPVQVSGRSEERRVGKECAD